MGLAAGLLLALSSATVAAAARFAVATRRFAVATSAPGHVSFLVKPGHRGSRRLVGKKTSRIGVVHVADGLFITFIYGLSVKVCARGRNGNRGRGARVAAQGGVGHNGIHVHVGIGKGAFRCQIGVVTTHIILYI